MCYRSIARSTCASCPRGQRSHEKDDDEEAEVEDDDVAMTFYRDDQARPERTAEGTVLPGAADEAVVLR